MAGSASPAERAPARTAERERLAEAIAEYRDAAAALERVERAVERGLESRTALREAVDAAEVALGEAEEAEPARYVSRLLGEAEDGPLPVAAAKAALAEARSALATAEHGRELLRQRLEHNERLASYAKSKVADAVTAVVRTSPGSARLVSQYDEALGRMQSLAGALRLLGRSRLPPEGERFDAIGRAVDVDHNIAGAWAAALAALQTDPDALLPGHDTGPETATA